MIRVAFSPIYIYSLPPGHRFPMVKYELIAEQLLHEGTVSEASFFHPQSVSDETLLLTHTPEYLAKLHRLDLTRREVRDIGFPVSKALIDRGKCIAQGTIDCALYAIEHGVALNVAGGTHHSFADRGEGFCVFNDFAIAANYLLSQKLAKQILIIDLDVHQGNGTAKIFENDLRVYTFSMHGERNYPLRKMQSDLDIGLPDQTDDLIYLSKLSDHLELLIDQVTPDIVFYLSGVDVLATDKLGRLALSRAGCRQRDEMVLSACHQRQIPVAVSMGGGYSHRIADIVEAHANTFRVAHEIYA